jgi:hypothetical protein
MATDAFLAENWGLLQENDPAALQILLSTVKIKNNPAGFAERLATTRRKFARGPTDTKTENMDEPLFQADQIDDFARKLKEFEQERTLANREINPNAKVYKIGLEETLHFKGRFKEIPTPAYCMLCKIQIPNDNQATAHCESRGHRSECEKAADAMMAKQTQARTPKGEGSDKKVTFGTSIASAPVGPSTSKRELGEHELREHHKRHKGDTAETPSRGRIPLSKPSSKPASVEYFYAGANCPGRFSVPAGEARGVGQCRTCKFTQVAGKPVRD